MTRAKQAPQRQRVVGLLAHGALRYTRTSTSAANGQFKFYNVPFNTYRVTVTQAGFQTSSLSVEVNSVVPSALLVKLGVAGAASSVTVETGSDLVETDSTFHTDVDHTMIDKMPLESASSSLSSMVNIPSDKV